MFYFQRKAKITLRNDKFSIPFQGTNYIDREEDYFSILSKSFDVWGLKDDFKKKYDNIIKLNKKATLFQFQTKCFVSFIY